MKKENKNSIYSSILKGIKINSDAAIPNKDRATPEPLQDIFIIVTIPSSEVNEKDDKFLHWSLSKMNKSMDMAHNIDRLQNIWTTPFVDSNKIYAKDKERPPREAFTAVGTENEEALEEEIALGAWDSSTEANRVLFQCLSDDLKKHIFGVNDINLATESNAVKVAVERMKRAGDKPAIDAKRIRIYLICEDNPNSMQVLNIAR